MTSMHKLPSYDAITTALQDCQVPMIPAEIHGLITGILTVTHDVKASINGVRNLVPEPDAEDETTQKGISILKILCAITALQLEDHHFDFHLLIPSDDVSLAARTDAVALWCQGFVSGLGEGGLSLPTENAAELTDIIHDLSSISQVDSSTIDDSEEEEVAYHELVEYVRVVVMTLYTDARGGTETVSQSHTIP